MELRALVAADGFEDDEDGETDEDESTEDEGMGPDGAADVDGLAVEDFDQPANLMLTCAIRRAGGAVISRSAADPFDLEAHAECLALAAAFGGWSARGGS